MTNPSPPVVRIPTGQELYDKIMGNIEPELTHDGIEKAKETYQNETPAQKAERQKRYDLAFERYDQAYAGYMETLHAQVKRERRQNIAQVEVEDRERDTGYLSGLENALFAT